MSNHDLRYTTTLRTAIGPLTLRARAPRKNERDVVLTGLFFSNDARGEDTRLVKDDALLLPLRRELEEYLAGDRRRFDLALDFDEGTPFQQRVWRTLGTIPFGRTWSYAQLAVAIDRPAAIRAVGAANGRNPIAIVLPCHRVIGADGRLVGFGGGLPTKAKLLSLEGLSDLEGRPLAVGSVLAKPSMEAGKPSRRVTKPSRSRAKAS
ncbi:MAG: methylated-DNA--[protein]-cysteine S-methyltransferase [Deltaproteobacteria bacterium]|nr:methylated-DNA--[protein]-cysteine S-methyltransferase [Deltaproteobacteria bacterium]